jgi:hypothetical protein
MFRFGGVLVVLGGLAGGPVVAQDTREAAVRTPAERAFILGQMRLFLGSVQAIAADLAEGDMKAVTTEAAARGRRGTPLSEIPPGLKAKETPAWGAMMGGVRKGFDGMAEAAGSGATAVEVMGLMGETMRNCVACHQTYRLVEE